MEKTVDQLELELAAALQSNQVILEENTSLKEKLSVAENKLAAVASAAKPEAAKSNDVFEYDGKQYQVLVPAVHIPGIGRRTALELASDHESLKYLIESGSGVIKEVK